MCGDTHAAALLADGSVVTWGDGYRGKLGGGDEENAPEPLHVSDLDDSPVRQIACGPNCTMAVTHSGSLKVWGDVLWGEGIQDPRGGGGGGRRAGVGGGTVEWIPREVGVGAGESVWQVSCGSHFAAAVTLTLLDSLY